MKITPVENKVFGAVVAGISLAELTDDEFAQIKSAFLEYGFLIFPAQNLSEEESASFGERFGKLEFGGTLFANVAKQEDGSFGEVIAFDSQRMRTNIGNEAWHTDSTYKPISAKCGILSAVVVPDKGGETQLADMRAGYAALDQATKDRIANLSAYHSTEYSQANDLGDFPQRDDNSIYHGEAYLRPLVKVHPDSGVKNLFVGRHAFGIPGLPREESKRLIRSLIDFVVSEPARVYQHNWKPGDTLLWDNRAILHCAEPYDYAKARVLIGTRVAGEPESELAYYPSDPQAQAGRDALRAELDLLREEAKDRRYGSTTAADRLEIRAVRF
jgi:alpha-ketoglutarate-dependent taurine dioxygenase